MSEQAVETKSHEYPMPHKGVNLHTSIQEIQPEECLISKNIYWKGGMIKRGGMSVDTTNNTEVSSSNGRIWGLHRFYFGSSKQTIAAAHTVVAKDDEDDTWTNIHTGLTADKQVYFTTWQGKLYTANGTDSDANNHINSWDGSSTAAVGTTDTITAVAQQYLPYQDRLLAIVNTGNRGTLEWSDSFDDSSWLTVTNTNVAPDTFLYGMINHSISNVDAGYEAGVLIAGADSMYLFKGTVLSGTTDYKIYTLAIPVGCNAPRTMCWTPEGSMWLGIDKQVYILPFDSLVPIPIGHKIRTTNTEQLGIESTPAAQIENACAVYHDGFYKLSISGTGNATNNTQWWLEVSRPQRDQKGLYGPWFGPMEGQNISCFANTNGPGDSGILLGGEMTEYGYVYELHNRSNLGDLDPSDLSAQAYQTRLRMFYNPLDSMEFNKVIHKLEAELLNVTNTVTIDFHDITGGVRAGETITVTASGNLWDGSILWDGSETWGGTVPIRTLLELTSAIRVRRLSLIFTTNNSTTDFQLFAVRVEAKEDRVSYQKTTAS